MGVCGVVVEFEFEFEVKAAMAMAMESSWKVEILVAAWLPACLPAS